MKYVIHFKNKLIGAIKQTDPRGLHFMFSASFFFFQGGED